MLLSPASANIDEHRNASQVSQSSCDGPGRWSRVINRRELNKFVRTTPLDQLSDQTEWYRNALEKRRRQGVDTTQAIALLDHVAEVLDYVAQAENVLAQGVDMYWGARAGASESRV